MKALPFLIILVLAGCGNSKDQGSLKNDARDYVVEKSGSFSLWILNTLKCQFSPKNIGFGGCSNCGRKWCCVENHTINLGDTGMFPLCEDCFRKLRMKNVKFYIEILLARWKKAGTDKTQHLDDYVLFACKDKYPFIKKLHSGEPSFIPFSNEADEALSVCGEAARNLEKKK